MKTTLERVYDVFVCCQHPRSELGDDVTPKGLGVDSLGAVDLAIQLEMEFDIEVTDQETECLSEKTIAEIAAIVDSKIAAKEAA